MDGRLSLPEGVVVVLLAPRGRKVPLLKRRIHLTAGEFSVRLTYEQKKKTTFRLSSSVPTQVGPVTLCVPTQPDFRTLV